MATETETLPAGNETGSEATDVQKLGLVYRCKKCRRIVASDDNIVTHERGKGQESFKWKKRSVGTAPAECSSIFVEPMKWMETVQEGFVGEKLLCIGCNGRLGSFNWAGMQCNCGAWINPAFQLHKSRLDECPL
ncbi:Probable inactive dual specificity protein phosphatase-like At4g18593 [Linum grandiflorum]